MRLQTTPLSALIIAPIFILVSTPYQFFFFFFFYFFFFLTPILVFSVVFYLAWDQIAKAKLVYDAIMPNAASIPDGRA